MFSLGILSAFGLGKAIAVFAWLVLVIIFVILELISLGLSSIWFAVGALVAGIVAMFGGPIWLQIIVFIVVTAITLACTRKVAKKHLDGRIQKTNSEGLIGQTSVCIETIDQANGTGKIRIGDVEWTARPVDDKQVIPNGSKVIIREIKGVKCMVELAE